MNKKVDATAREFGMTPQELMTLGMKLGIEWEELSSAVSDEEQDTLRDYFEHERKKKSKVKKQKSETSALKKVRKKKKDLTGVQKREMSRKTAHITISGLAVLILTVGIYGTLRAYSFNSELLRAEKNISALQKLKTTKAGMTVTQKPINYPRVEQFFSGYVSHYMNADTTKLSERETELQKYYSFTSNEMAPAQNRVLDSTRLFSVEEQENFTLASFLVTYHFDGASITALLNIPYTEDSNKFSIISAPYFTEVPDSSGQGKALLQIDSSDHSPEVERNQKELLKFLSVFFEKYAGNQTDDLKLLMKTPDYQGGNFALNQLDISAVKILYRKDRFIIQVPVSFKDKDSNFVHTENFTLTIEKRKDGTFLVDELKHYYTEEK